MKTRIVKSIIVTMILMIMFVFDLHLDLRILIGKFFADTIVISLAIYFTYCWAMVLPKEFWELFTKHEGQDE